MLAVGEREPLGVVTRVERDDHAVVRIVLDRGHAQRREGAPVVTGAGDVGVGHHNALNNSNGSLQAAHT